MNGPSGTSVVLLITSVYLLLPMVLVEWTRTDEGVRLGNELVVCELEMLTRMDDENVFPGKKDLVDCTQLGTMDLAVLDEWQHFTGMMQETTRVIVHHPVSFHVHLSQYLGRW